MWEECLSLQCRVGMNVKAFTLKGAYCAAAIQYRHCSWKMELAYVTL